VARLVRAAVVVAILGLLAGVLWIALTALAPSGWRASWAPCARDWGWAPAWSPRASPLHSVSIDFERGHAKLCYGAPSARGRRMIGGEAVPYGRLWRTGANEPTTLHLDRAVELADLYLAPGSYSLYTVPGAEAWQVIVSRSTSQWGLESEYAAVAGEEVGRFEVATVRLAEPVETLRFRAEPEGGDRWRLVLEWETTRIALPIDGGADRPTTPGRDREPF
jgi:hypothetical protein